MFGETSRGFCGIIITERNKRAKQKGQDNMMTTKEIAYKVLEENSKERKEAEKMMGCPLSEMTDEQKTIMLGCLTAFQGKY